MHNFVGSMQARDLHTIENREERRISPFNFPLLACTSGAISFSTAQLCHLACIVGFKAVPSTNKWSNKT